MKVKSLEEILSKYTKEELKELVKQELDRANISYEEGNFENNSIDFELKEPTYDEYMKSLEEK